MQNAYARIALTLGIIFSVATFNTGFAAYSPTDELASRESDATKPAIEAQTELYCLALAVYFEGGSTAESEDGQRHIARVVIERAKENQRKWGGSKLCDVVFYKRAGVCQFSFACLPQAQRTSRGGAAWQRSLSIAQEELEAKSEVGDDGIRYYLNAALTSNRNVCRFRRELVPVVEAGRHQFFREPTADERAALAKSEFAECEDAKKRAVKLSADKKKRFAAISKKKGK
jgi:spore germination cell wall hydrolase CwlJ-like protein